MQTCMVAVFVCVAVYHSPLFTSSLHNEHMCGLHWGMTSRAAVDFLCQLMCLWHTLLPGLTARGRIGGSQDTRLSAFTLTNTFPHGSARVQDGLS